MDKQELAVNYFSNGYNCAQAVVLAFCEDFGISKELAARIIEGFGGGMGRTRSVCGAVSGMVTLAGMRDSKGEAGDMETRIKIYGNIKNMINEFEKEYGSKICAELMVKGDTTPGAGGHQKNCVDCVKTAAKIAEKYLSA